MSDYRDYLSLKNQLLVPQNGFVETGTLMSSTPIRLAPSVAQPIQNMGSTLASSGSAVQGAKAEHVEPQKYARPLQYRDFLDKNMWQDFDALNGPGRTVSAQKMQIPYRPGYEREESITTSVPVGMTRQEWTDRLQAIMDRPADAPYARTLSGGNYVIHEAPRPTNGESGAPQDAVPAQNLSLMGLPGYGASAQAAYPQYSAPQNPASMEYSLIPKRMWGTQSGRLLAPGSDLIAAQRRVALMGRNASAGDIRRLAGREWAERSRGIDALSTYGAPAANSMDWGAARARDIAMDRDIAKGEAMARYNYAMQAPQREFNNSMELGRLGLAQDAQAFRQATAQQRLNLAQNRADFAQRAKAAELELKAQAAKDKAKLTPEQQTKKAMWDNGYFIQKINGQDWFVDRNSGIAEPMMVPDAQNYGQLVLNPKLEKLGVFKFAAQGANGAAVGESAGMPTASAAVDALGL